MSFYCFNCRYETRNRWNMRRRGTLKPHGWWYR